MKNFIKNNLKVFVAIIISGILFTGIGVYAANTYLAHDISYTPNNDDFDVNNVEDALNELYTQSEKNKVLQPIQIILRAATTSSNGQGELEFNNLLMDKYDKFKVELINIENTLSSCYARVWSNSLNQSLDLEFGKEYLINNKTDGYNYNAIYADVSAKKIGTYGACRMLVTFYN